MNITRLEHVHESTATFYSKTICDYIQQPNIINIHVSTLYNIINIHVSTLYNIINIHVSTLYNIINILVSTLYNLTSSTYNVHDD